MIFSFSLFQTILFSLTALLVLFLPGMVWIAWSYHDGRDWIERIADALGLSVAMIAITGMLFYFLGLQFSWIFIFSSYSLCSILLVVAFFKNHVRLTKVDFFVLVGLMFTLTGMVLWRFFQASTLAFPAWVDSVHHVLIVQKILDYQGIPGTLAPELPINFTYHFGFHIITALWSAITGLKPVDSVLWFGQVLNALIALGIYRVAKQFWKDSRIAILAAFLVAFAFQMPAYYLTWGRYTLITGLLVMLPAMATSIELISHQFRREVFLRMVILTGGLALIHYMALMYFGLFVACLISINLLFNLWERRKNKKTVMLRRLSNLVLSLLAGILIASPWLVRMLVDQITIAGVNISLPNWNDFKNSLWYIIYLLGPTHNYWLFGLAFLGVVYAWFQKNDRSVVLWATLLVVLSVPFGLKLGPFRPDHMAIVLFVPAAWFLANGFINVADFAFDRFGRKISNLIIFVFGIAMLIWGGWHTKNVLNSVTILADQSDRLALNWIEKNVPEDARFFSNTTSWQYNTYRGVDGGYWITPILKRFSLAMPSLYAYAKTEQKELWKEWITTANQISTCDDAFFALVRHADLDYIYVREGKGSLQPGGLENCKGIVPVYIFEGVWIYQITE